jgi:hypothetical protein
MAKNKTQQVEQTVSPINFDALTISADCEKYSFALSEVSDARLSDVLSVKPAFFVRSKFAKSSKNNHQVPNNYRVEGCNPIMPNVARVLESGNAYPNTLSEVAKVKVSREIYAHYRDVVFVAHHVFNALANDTSEAGLSAIDLYYNSDVIAKASADKGKPISQASRTNGNHIYYGICDTLRDLECFGIVYAVNSKNGTRRAETKYKMNNEYVRIINDMRTRASA